MKGFMIRAILMKVKINREKTGRQKRERERVREGDTQSDKTR